MNIKITHGTCEVGVFMCRSLFQDLVYVGATVLQCVLVTGDAFLPPKPRKSEFPFQHRVCKRTQTMLTKIKRSTLALRN